MCYKIVKKRLPLTLPNGGRPASASSAATSATAKIDLLDGDLVSKCEDCVLIAMRLPENVNVRSFTRNKIP